MAEPAVATEVHQALDVLLHFAAQITFDLDGLDRLAQGLDVRLGQLVHLAIVGDLDLVADELRGVEPDAVDVRQGVGEGLAAREIDAGYARHDDLEPALTSGATTDLKPEAIIIFIPCGPGWGSGAPTKKH